MAEKTIHLIPDTNIFIQCRPLQDLDWTLATDATKIHIIVCQPVIRQIDSQKYRGSERVGRRARRTNSLFRGIVESGQGWVILRASRPEVKLLLEPRLRPSNAIANDLNYELADDQIVGCLLAYEEANPGVDARLLTGDTGMMLTAQGVDLPFIAVNPEWLLPAENSAVETENIRLKKELEELRKAAPQLSATWLDENGDGVDQLTTEYRSVKPASTEEMEELLNLLQKRVPIATFDKFSTEEAASTDPLGFARTSALAQRLPPTPEQVARYRDEAYPNWIRECQKVFEGFHKTVEKIVGRPRIRLRLGNAGSRPAMRVLLTLQAFGDVKLRWAGDHRESALEDLVLPDPPPPPKWRTLHDLFGVRDLSALLGSALPLGGEPSFELPRIADAFRESEEFRVRSGGSGIVRKIELERDRWRHGLSEEEIEVTLDCIRDGHEREGMISVEINAENLPTPVRATLSVRASMRSTSVVDYGKILIDSLPDTA